MPIHHLAQAVRVVEGPFDVRADLQTIPYRVEHHMEVTVRLLVNGLLELVALPEAVSQDHALAQGRAAPVEKV
jgi:hypothetical protein